MADLKQMVFVGQGPIAIGEFDATNGIAAEGYLVRQKLIGCGHRKLSFAHSRETGKVQEDCSGNRGTLATWTKGQEIKCSLELTQFSREDLAMGLYGQSISRAAGTVTNEALRAGLAVGEVFHLKYPQASSVVIKDSAGSPATLTAGTHYEMQSLPHGRGRILDLASFVQPLKADYSYAAHAQVTAFTAASTRRGLIFDGINISDGNAPVRVIVPLVDFSPTASFDWIGTDEQVLTLEGEVLYVAQLAADPNFGPYYKVDALPADA